MLVTHGGTKYGESLAQVIIGTQLLSNQIWLQGDDHSVSTSVAAKATIPNLTQNKSLRLLNQVLNTPPSTRLVNDKIT